MEQNAEQQQERELIDPSTPDIERSRKTRQQGNTLKKNTTTTPCFD